MRIVSELTLQTVTLGTAQHTLGQPPPLSHESFTQYLAGLGVVHASNLAGLLGVEATDSAALASGEPELSHAHGAGAQPAHHHVDVSRRGFGHQQVFEPGHVG